MADKNKRNLSYLHKVERTKVEKGKVTVSEESVSHGDNGIIVKYFHKENKNSKKILIIANNGEYTIKETDSKDGQKGDTKEEKVTKDKLLKFIKKEKLDFALEYIEQHGGNKASRKSSKKASKKGSKRGSKQSGGKKASRKSSKKASKKGSKRGSKQSGGKKASRKSSKKASKKGSKRGSKQSGGKKASRKSSKKASKKASKKKSSKKQLGGNDDGLQLGGKKRSSKKVSKRGSKSKKGSRK